MNLRLRYFIMIEKMQIINHRLDFLIKFPIIFPLIYYLLIKSFPNYEMYNFFNNIIVMEPHFGLLASFLVHLIINI